MPNSESTDVRVTVIAPESVMNEIKFIAVWEKKKQKDLMSEILTAFIVDWKAKNKGVKFPS